MADKIHTSELRLTGKDATGKLFEDMAGKMRVTERAAKSLGGAIRSIGDLPSRLGTLDKTTHKVAGAVAATYATHKAMQVGEKVIDAYKEFDDIRRYMK